MKLNLENFTATIKNRDTMDELIFTLQELTILLKSASKEKDRDNVFLLTNAISILADRMKEVG